LVEPVLESLVEDLALRFEPRLGQLSDSTRLELAAQGTHVVAVHMGLVDTDMAKGIEAPKIAPSDLANAGLDAIESGAQEVLADDWAKFIKSGLTLEPKARYEQIFGALGG
jgi:NAD(P)-dependent dehydrogenase (short-subunit alcohol dehydrogenase family)